MVVIASVDRSDRGRSIVQEAHRLAEAFGDPVEVAHVLTRSEFVDLERTNVEDTGQAIPREEIIEVARDIARDRIATSGVDAIPVGLLGDPADEIVRYAESQDARYVVIGGRKRSPVGKALFGSVGQSILLESPSPVVSLRLE